MLKKCPSAHGFHKGNSDETVEQQLYGFVLDPRLAK
jgi:hypothetical protein